VYENHSFSLSFLFTIISLTRRTVTASVGYKHCNRRILFELTLSVMKPAGIVPLRHNTTRVTNTRFKASLLCCRVADFPNNIQCTSLRINDPAR